MFSGIVEEMGTLIETADTGGGRRLTIGAREILKDAKIGESISVSGTCLTVVEFTPESLEVEVVNESLRCTTLGNLNAGDKVNLEKALRFNDRLGGHMVTGHVDTIARVLSIVDDGFSRLVTFGLEGRWAPFFVKKGSVCIEGVSLTVVDCSALSNGSASGSRNNADQPEFRFSVALIPHTLEVTTLGALKVGQAVNIETDVIARYVVRLLGEGYLANLNKDRETVV